MNNYDQANIARLKSAKPGRLKADKTLKPKRSIWKSNLLAVLMFIVGVTALVTAVVFVIFALLPALQLMPITSEDALLVALGSTLLGAVLLYLSRRRVLQDAALQVEAGCPHCKEHNLLRIRRQRSDRVLSALGLPIRRYACRLCRWQGRRVATPHPKNARRRSLRKTRDAAAYATEETPHLAAVTLASEDPNVEALSAVDAVDEMSESTEASMAPPASNQAVTLDPPRAESEAEEDEIDPEFARLCYEAAKRPRDDASGSAE